MASSGVLLWILYAFYCLGVERQPCVLHRSLILLTLSEYSGPRTLFQLPNGKCIVCSMPGVERGTPRSARRSRIFAHTQKYVFMYVCICVCVCVCVCVCICICVYIYTYIMYVFLFGLGLYTHKTKYM